MYSQITIAAGLSLILLGTVFGSAPAEETGPLARQLEPLRPLLGKTWKGTGPGATPGKSVTDVSRWERALNGQAVRTLHSINDGEYGGETLIFWDRAEGSLVYYYFTTAGFYTHGKLTPEGTRFVAHETVSGNENGVTEVRSTSEILPDGTMQTKSEYLQNGTWVPGHSFLYREDPSAQVVFR